MSKFKQNDIVYAIDQDNLTILKIKLKHKNLGIMSKCDFFKDWIDQAAKLWWKESLFYNFESAKSNIIKYIIEKLQEDLEWTDNGTGMWRDFLGYSNNLRLKQNDILECQKALNRVNGLTPDKLILEKERDYV